jgi:hypothetical protein
MYRAGAVIVDCLEEGVAIVDFPRGESRGVEAGSNLHLR